MLETLTEKLRKVSFAEVCIYSILYLVTGILMNSIGIYFEIVRFEYWWQIITCYVLYMVPISILIKEYSFFNQYCYGLLAIGILELSGYTFQTSYVYPNNILSQLFTPYNLTLAMTLFFAVYFPLGNMLVSYIYKKLPLQKKLLQ
ncbi:MULTISPECIES: hypothetical protein [Aequorivita]|uniref:Uncharacterized protein n=1 Tax=Aequorivita iocasae TaxID=2803865 RepID=A0ABX7DUK5_9FLAO|nr:MULTISPECIES: hypothetical protein [Aequorivita]QQX77258.1 hypothetical protein JK629_03015 [Aequorivita iocasae]UCA56747.1 hypothetical protein LDL78_03035 [Aequorivita sp. F7]